MQPCQSRIKSDIRCKGIMEMTPLSQSPRDRILWLLANYAGKMEQSRLRRRMGMRYAVLNPILDELAREGKIRITSGKHEDLISLENAR